MRRQQAKQERVPPAGTSGARVRLLCECCKHLLDQMTGGILHPSFFRAVPDEMLHLDEDAVAAALFAAPPADVSYAAAYECLQMAGLTRLLARIDGADSVGQVWRTYGLRLVCKHCGAQHPVRADKLNTAYFAVVSRPARDRVIVLPRDVSGL
ncbi:hypothetical protein AB0H43_10515 [Hamadaea sp. NPDC050747]|uniref:hypothetical protein n=1 Tax=Hamadaea sp. NPDC050747 TaxID=3155789 RepID=UPI0034045C86